VLIESVSTENFRLLERASIDLAPGANLFLGENAQGKTSVLEAVSYLSSGRSFRTSRDRECIRFDPATKGSASEFAAVECRFLAHEVRHQIRCAITPDEKSCWVDGNRMQKLGDLWGTLNVVVFVPSDLELVRGGPDLRRALVGELLARSSKYDLSTMQKYATALRHRNALLREDQQQASGMFEVYEGQLAEYGARLMAARERLITQFAVLAEEHLRHLTGGNDTFNMRHEPGFPKSAGIPSDCLLENNAAHNELKARLANLWEAQRLADIERGYTQNGPHRADMSLSLNGSDARTFSSQGQARTIALALRLAEVEILTIAAGAPPVLLLDDVLGDLDQARTEQFVRLLSRRGVQSLITATDSRSIEARLPIGARFNVKKGNVERARA
jgi:DNA replication and repair protein RecF